MIKTLIVFYSLEGNTRSMAESMAKAIDAEMLELKPKQDIPGKGLMKFVKGGAQAMKKVKPELQPLAKNVSDYDLIFLGSPVWAGNYAPALRTLLDDADLSGKKVALFCCHGGGKGKTLRKMRDDSGATCVLSEIDFVEPLKKGLDENAARAAKWAKEVYQSAGG